MSNIIKTTYGKVQSYLRIMYGEQYDHVVSEVDHRFIITRGSAAVSVSIKPWHEENCIIEALAYVVHGAKMNTELMNFLLRENSRTPFGAFGISFDHTITFSHSITGANLDLNELQTTVRHVAFMADEYDDRIRAIAGGFRAVDGNAAIMSDVSVSAPSRVKITVARRAKPAAKKQAGKKVIQKKQVIKSAAKIRKTKIKPKKKTAQKKSKKK